MFLLAPDECSIVQAVTCTRIRPLRLTRLGLSGGLPRLEPLYIYIYRGLPPCFATPLMPKSTLDLSRFPNRVTHRLHPYGKHVAN